MSGEIVVLKFGSSVLESPSDIPGAVHEIYGWYRNGHRVVAVASAIGQAANWPLVRPGSSPPIPSRMR